MSPPRSESMANQTQILIATSNHGKVAEIREALSSLPVRLRQLDEFPKALPIKETGATYEENAALKALGYAEQTGIYALADDSGLEVEVLSGKPGVHSARFGGEHLADRERTQKLLLELSEFSGNQRQARFVCSMALAGWHGPANGQTNPQILTTTRGVCPGALTKDFRGENGFGFDPIFIPDGYDLTFGELPIEVKNEISHRARALEAMRLFLIDWLSLT